MKGAVEAESMRESSASRVALEHSSLTPQRLAEEGVKFVPQTLRFLGVPAPVVLDATQDVFLVALRRMADFEGRSSLKTWLYGICVRVAHGYRRRDRSSRETLVESMPEGVAPASQEEAVEHVEWQRALGELLEQLEGAQREVFVLFEIQRLTMKEVAEVLGCPLQTAYFRHKAARAKVLEAFRSRREAEEV